MSNNNLPISFNINSIKIHSKHIKDLMEKGDYINGIKIINIFWDKEGEMIVIETADKRKYYHSQIIHSIVTKEQFAQMEYKVGE